VECTGHEHCDHGCDVSSQKCLACTVDADCSAPNPACDSISRTCVTCLSDNHCSDPLAPACDVSTRQCVECTSDLHCGGENGACFSSANKCVECTLNSFCADGQVCDVSVMQCVECLADGDCVGHPNRTHCDTQDEDLCVECIVDSHCPSEIPVCDSKTRSCVECNTASDCWLRDAATPICRGGLCSACTDDLECAANFLIYQACDDGICVADQYKKGFYISAVVMGSVAIFLVSGALIAILAGAAAK